MTDLRELYMQWCGEQPPALEKIEGLGRNSEYYRI